MSGIHLERARGALLGLSVGDALGTTLEFTRGEAPAFPALAQGPHREVVGQGPFNLQPGQVTDDTQMACALAASLVSLKRFDPEDVGRRYVAWRQVAFDVGMQIDAALTAISRGGYAVQSDRPLWIANGRRSAGNGSLMRTAPIGVFFAEDSVARRAASFADSAITHFDPRCQLACAVLNAAIAAGLLADAPDPKVLFRAAEKELDQALTTLSGRIPEEAAAVAEAGKALAADLAAARQDDPHLYGPEVHLLQMQGFVRVAFRLAFWELVHAPSYEAGLVDVVNRGGDADTNGAVAGALLGACWGAQAIPERWSAPVLAALENQSGPLRDAYHPRQLLTLADPSARGEEFL